MGKFKSLISSFFLRITSSFRSKLLLSFLALSFVPLILSGFLMVKILSDNTSNEEIQQSKDASSEVDYRMNVLLSGIKDSFTSLENSSALKETVASKTDNQDVYNLLYETTAGYRSYADFSVYSTDGTCVLSTDIVKDLPEYWGVLKDAKASQGQIVIRSEGDSNQPVLRIAKAIIVDDKVTGFIAASLDNANMAYLLSGIVSAQEGINIMTLEELAKKAIEESNGKTFYGLGNSSRGKTALPLFISYLQTIDPSYNMQFEWQQPKNNKIFEQLQADSVKSEGTFAMTLIQDGNQIESKMNQPGILKTFVPKEWAEANNTTAADYTGFLPLQTLNKVFEFNNKGTKTWTNCWDFVMPDAHPLYMDIDSEIVGKNFLYMLTKDEYAKELKDAFDALPSSQKSTLQPTVDEMKKNSEEFNLGENGAYALAWIKLWVNGYNAQTDDGPICNTLTSASAVDQSGLLVYSKLRSIEESSEQSVNNVTVAAYQDGYKGIGGYGYCHYLFLTKNSPLPWTAAAFIAYMT